MRIRNVKNADDLVKNSTYVINNPESYKGNYQELFNNDNPINVEIGMGKGDFIINMALSFPNINFIGIEKYGSIIVRALKKLENKRLDNLKIICTDAINLENIFDHEISTMYLNFSDPWPKKRHAKRRLTSEIFLRIYDNIFKDKNVIIQKTDNISLLESSIISLSCYGYIIEDISLDLHSRDMFNIMTEYERKYSLQGVKINYLKATKK